MNPRTAVEELARTGMTDQAIADKVGTSNMTINRVRNGKHRMKDWHLGQALISLAEERKPRIKKK